MIFVLRSVFIVIDITVPELKYNIAEYKYFIY